MRAPVAELVGVFKVFDEGRVHALAGIDLVVRRGEFLAVVGKSGSGKSTLLNVLGLLDRTTSGTYKVQGVDVESTSERLRTQLRARSVGFVFQDSHLIPTRTVAENIEFALRMAEFPRSERRDMARDLIGAVGLEDRSDVLPGTLSGGERQRAAIARALVHRPSLLLCDEPTGNLDTANSEMVVDLLRTVPDSNCAVVLVTHDLELAARADRQIELSDGRIVSRRGKVAGEQAPQGGQPPIERSSTASRIAQIADGIEDTGLNVARRPGRALLASLGTLLAVGLLVFGVTLSSTAASRIEQEFDLLAATSVRLSGSDTLDSLRDPDIESDVASLPGVEGVGRRWSIGNHEVVAGDGPWVLDSVIAPVRAVSDGAVANLEPQIDGPGFLHSDTALGSPAVLIGQVLVDDLDVPIVAGSRLWLSGRRFIVRGVIEDVGRSPEVLFEVLLPAATAERYWPDEAKASEVVVDVELGAAETVASELPYVVDPSRSNELFVAYPPEAERLASAVTTQVDEFVVILAASLLIVSAFGIASSSLAGILERRYEIGLRRALGMSRFGIGSMIVGETAVTGLIASLLGLVAALLAALVISVAREWAPVVPTGVLLLAPLAGTVVGFVAGLIPAVQAAALQPVDALRR